MRLRRPQVPRRYDTQRDYRYLYIPVHRCAKAGMHIQDQPSDIPGYRDSSFFRQSALNASAGRRRQRTSRSGIYDALYICGGGMTPRLH